MRFVPEILRRNWTLKLSALGLAVILWAARRVETPTRQPLPGVPVEVQLEDPSYALAGQPVPPTVELRVGGPSRALFQLALDPPSIVVPMEEVTGSDTTVVLRREWVRIDDAPGVVVEDIEPAAVRLSFEPIESAAIPIVPLTRGSLPESLALAAPVSTNPRVARLSGPRSRIQAVDSARLAAVDLARFREPGTHRLQLPVDTAGLSDLLVAPTSASVTVLVEERVERLLEEVEVRTEGPAGLTVDPTTITVSLQGARTLVEGTGADGVYATVALNVLEGLDEARRVPVEIRGVPDLVQASAEPDSVTVRPGGSP